MFEESIQVFLKLINGDSYINLSSPSKYAEDLWFCKEGYGPRDIHDHPGWHVINQGSEKGILVEGNAESILALAGTKYYPDFEDKILFIEASQAINERFF